MLRLTAEGGNGEEGGGIKEAKKRDRGGGVKEAKKRDQYNIVRIYTKSVSCYYIHMVHAFQVIVQEIKQYCAKSKFQLTKGFPDTDDQLRVEGLPTPLSIEQLHGSREELLPHVVEDVSVPTLEHQLLVRTMWGG